MSSSCSLSLVRRLAPFLGDAAAQGAPTTTSYTRAFELLLRQKANYLWPAMWGKSFVDDNPRNHELADRHGIVIGTSHHGPMMRAHVEWERYGNGPWNYRANADTLRQFWRRGIGRMNGYEGTVTTGMRGDGGKPATQGTAIDLLEQIVSDQWDILEDLTGTRRRDCRPPGHLYRAQQTPQAGTALPRHLQLRSLPGGRAHCAVVRRTRRPDRPDLRRPAPGRRHFAGRCCTWRRPAPIPTADRLGANGPPEEAYTR